jgi:Rap1a immunity proteins
VRTLSLFLLVACVLEPVYGQQKSSPTDGNGLLEYCSVIVDSVDSSSTLSSLTGDRFAEKVGQFSWCAGYLEAFHDMHIQNEVNLTIFGLSGVTLAGEEHVKQFAFDSLRGPCIPDKAPIIQLARVLVKWLREHPERLHELKSGLTVAAFKDAFPCEKPTTQKEVPKPIPPSKP